MAPHENPRKPVVRKLFQNEESNEDENIAEHFNALVERTAQELAQEMQMAREKWNFDFENETPLEGDWEWEKVEN
ncbi:unnamed protein product [Brassicogethes aeneus]|uniref:Cyclin-dependent kinase inhibitor domain-containing protein n=1 Tax=Brassicogethes aeneus TaxID=1431903 RepID=A0A9P0BCX0_BRAAE|nr:unnamed protein product [Brassicogethes aeneus]